MGKITQFIKRKVGKEIHSFSVEGDNFFDVVMTSKHLSFGDVEKCGLCGSDNLDLTAHLAKSKFKYVLIRCKKCKGYVNFGQQQENSDIFYLRTREDADKKKVLDWKEGTTPLEDQQ